MKDHSLVVVCTHLFVCRCRPDTFLSSLQKEKPLAKEADAKEQKQPPVAKNV
jgi:hypothetical protein